MSSDKVVLFIGSVSNLVIAAAGAGMLSYPYAVARCGIVGAIAATCVFSLLNSYTLGILAFYFWKLQFDNIPDGITPKEHLRPQINTYEDLIDSYLGRRARLAAQVTILIGSIGALIAFYIIIGDLGTEVSHQFCTASSTGCLLARSRWIISLGTSVLVLPLAFSAQIQELWISSVIAVLAIVFVAAVVASSEGRSDREPLHSSPPILDVFRGLPIIVFSLGNHLQLIPVLNEFSARWNGVSCPPSQSRAARTVSMPLVRSNGASERTDGGVPGALPASQSRGDGPSLQSRMLEYGATEAGKGGPDGAPLADVQDFAYTSDSSMHGTSGYPEGNAEDGHGVEWESEQAGKHHQSLDQEGSHPLLSHARRGVAAAEGKLGISLTKGGTSSRERRNFTKVEVFGPQQVAFFCVIAASAFVCVVLYLSTGVLGALAFGSGVDGDVLVEFALDDVMASVAKGVMAMHIALAFPVVLYPCKMTILDLLKRGCWTAGYQQDALPTRHERGDGGYSYQDVESTVQDLQSEEQTHASVREHEDRRDLHSVQNESDHPTQGCAWQNTSVSIALTVLPAIAAVAFPQVAVVFGFLGATISVTQLYVFPAALLLYGDDEPLRWPAWHVISAVLFLAAVAALITVVGTMATALAQ